MNVNGINRKSNKKTYLCNTAWPAPESNAGPVHLHQLLNGVLRDAPQADVYLSW